MCIEFQGILVPERPCFVLPAPRVLVRLTGQPISQAAKQAGGRDGLSERRLDGTLGRGAGAGSVCTVQAERSTGCCGQRASVRREEEREAQFLPWEPLTATLSGPGSS